MIVTIHIVIIELKFYSEWLKENLDGFSDKRSSVLQKIYIFPLYSILRMTERVCLHTLNKARDKIPRVTSRRARD